MATRMAAPVSIRCTRREHPCSSALRVLEPIGAMLKRLPQRPPSAALTAALNLGLMRQLERLRGKVIRIEMNDAGLRLTLSFDGRAFRARSDKDPAHLTIAADIRDFGLLALRKQDPDTLFFARRLVMEGGTELGLMVRNMLDAIDMSAVSAGLETPITL